MYDMQVVYYLLGFLAFWLIVVSLAVFWLYRFIRGLSKQFEKGNLVDVLKGVIEKENKNTEGIKYLDKEIKRIDEENIMHVQRVGLVRFNPFKELGGDHSFSLALLDGDDTGFVLTGLHTRERTRVYAKQIKKGKSMIDLSDEESKALKLAQKQ